MSNDILSFIPGELITAAQLQLPTPPQEQSVVVDVPAYGRVRIHFRWHELKVRRETQRFWTAYRAESIGE